MSIRAEKRHWFLLHRAQGNYLLVTVWYLLSTDEQSIGPLGFSRALNIFSAALTHTALQLTTGD